MEWLPLIWTLLLVVAVGKLYAVHGALRDIAQKLDEISLNTFRPNPGGSDDWPPA